MRFFDVFKRRKFLFLNIFLFLYIAINLFTGDRGLLSYFEKSKEELDLKANKVSLKKEIKEIENKNLLLSDKIDEDFVDVLIRDKFKFGKKEEILIKINE
tara:strand:+ start:280 stop:579 length:300 start_codon:yes stop_codon:yes gene_type:complete